MSMAALRLPGPLPRPHGATSRSRGSSPGWMAVSVRSNISSRGHTHVAAQLTTSRDSSRGSCVTCFSDVPTPPRLCIPGTRAGGGRCTSRPGRRRREGGGVSSVESPEERRHGGRARMQAAQGRGVGSTSPGPEAGKGFGAPSLQDEPSSKKGGKGGDQPRPRSAEDEAFEERLAAIKRSAADKRRAEEARKVAPIDYDNPQETTSEVPSFFSKDLGSKIGIGVAAAMFAAIFAFGDIIPPLTPTPSSPPGTSSQSPVASQLNTLSPQLRDQYQAQLKAFQSILDSSPDDRTALEGAAVLYVELGDLPSAEALLERLEKVAPGDVEVLRLHAEVQYTLGAYARSTHTYRRALQASGPSLSVELLQGLTESLIADSRPKEAVMELLEVRKRTSASLADDAPGDDVDPVQVELLLGKAYAAWGKAGDAVAAYDRLIGARPQDFRGYLAKALLLKGQGKEGDSQRMFLQAKFLAPEAAKVLVDRLATS